MPRQKKAAQKRAVEERTQQRLAARREVAQRGAETKRRKREARAQAQAAPQAAESQGRRVQVADLQTGRPQRTVTQEGAATDRGPMVTVALRGEPAARLRALAASQKLSLANLLVRMMDSLEAQTG